MRNLLLSSCHLTFEASHEQAQSYKVLGSTVPIKQVPALQGCSEPAIRTANRDSDGADANHHRRLGQLHLTRVPYTLALVSPSQRPHCSEYKWLENQRIQTVKKAHSGTDPETLTPLISNTIYQAYEVLKKKSAPKPHYSFMEDVISYFRDVTVSQEVPP